MRALGGLVVVASAAAAMATVVSCSADDGGGAETEPFEVEHTSSGWLEVEGPSLRWSLEHAGLFELSDPAGALTIRVKPEVSPGTLLEQSSQRLRFGRDGQVRLELRAGPGSVEDWHYFDERPTEEALSYLLELGDGVAGLRRVGAALELIDAGGAPRLRMQRPFIVAAGGVRHEVDYSVRGCAVDRSPRAPWGRTPTPPGARFCHIDLDWSRAGVAYPAALDPAWGATGSMADGRRMHTATWLASDQVLIAGGRSGSSMIPDAELYDPTTRTFAATGAMNHPRESHAASILGDGRVLVMGASSGAGSNSAETWDATTGVWTLTGAPQSTHNQFRLTRLLDSKVLATGGNTAANQVELFDPTDGANGTWSVVSSYSGTRRYHTATLLNDGTVLVAGGDDITTTFRTSEVYSPTLDSWSPGPDMVQRRTQHAAVKLSDGRVVVFGSGSFSDNGARTGEIFDPAGPSWAQSIPAPDGTWRWPNLTLLNDGNLLLVGGTDSFILDLTGPSWAQAGTPDTGSGFRFFTTTLLLDGAVVLTGGFDGNQSLSGAQLFAPLLNGSFCTDSAECASGFCVDLVCCENACDGVCRRCDSSGSCMPQQANAADDHPTLGNRCAVDTGVCGFTGGCDGFGACAYVSDDTECAGSTCLDGDTAALALCDGSGACVPGSGQSYSCFPYTCQGDDCLSSCSRDEDCAAGLVCSGGACQSGAQNGAPCTDSGECLSTSCVDGVCCDSACGGVCESCLTEYTDVSDGTCAPIRAGEDPDDECFDSGAGCSDTGMCDGAGACAQYEVREDGGCDVGNCQSDSDCASGFCVEGVCCESRCDGQCESCFAEEQAEDEAQTGLCRAMKFGIDPDGDCTDVDPGDCVNPPLVCNGVERTCVCTDPGASCVGNKLVSAGGQEEDCEPYKCLGAERRCGTQCSSTADCSDGALCNADTNSCEITTAAAKSDDGGCGCRVPAPRSNGSGSGLGLLLLGLLGLRRTKRTAGE